MGAKKYVPIVQYPGGLGEPHVRIKPLWGLGLMLGARSDTTQEERQEEANRKNLEALGKKLTLLAQHYGAVNDAGIDWKMLAIDLAFAHVPGFLTVDEKPRRRGRPGQGYFGDFTLYTAVLAILDEGEPSVANACRTLTKRDGKWKGKNPASLETRFHESRRRAEAMNVRPHLTRPGPDVPTNPLFEALFEISDKPSAKYPPVPLFGFMGMGARALYDHEKS